MSPERPINSISFKRANRTFPPDEHDAIHLILKQEIDLGRIHGPFSELPFHNPIITSIFVVPKPSSDGSKKFRLIHNLSVPDGESVNDAICDDDAIVAYERFDHVIDMVNECGPGALISKFDIESAYRLCRIREEDWRLLCFRFDGYYYFESVMAFGCRSSCNTFESFGNFISSCIKHKIGITRMMRYVDDFAFFFSFSDNGINEKWNNVLQFMRYLGIPLSASKIKSPCTCITILGFQIDTASKLITIPVEKQQAILDIISSVLNKTKISKHLLQQLLGKLCFAARVLRMSRPFLRRLYQRLAAYKSDHQKLRLPSDCRNDLLTWRQFFVCPLGPLKLFNHHFIPDSVLHLFTDSSLYGFGGIFGSEWIVGTWDDHFSEQVKSNSITFLEFFPIIVSLVVWSKELSGKKILFHCDNRALVDVLNKLSASDKGILRLLRFFVVKCVTYDIEVKAVHVPGKLNVISDALSRGDYKKFRALHPTAVNVPTEIPAELWLI